MKKLMMGMLAAGAALTIVGSAQAAGGCGVGGHRGPYGGCRGNFGPGPIVGSFYPGHGYWSGGRYWGNRYRWHGGWRYR